MLRIFIFYNNHVSKLLKNWKKSNKWIVEIFFFVINEFVNVSEYIRIFSKFLYIFENILFEQKFKAVTVELLVQSSGKS